MNVNRYQCQSDISALQRIHTFAAYFEVTYCQRAEELEQAVLVFNGALRLEMLHEVTCACIHFWANIGLISLINIGLGWAGP